MSPVSFNPTNYANYNVRRPRRNQETQPQFSMPQIPQYQYNNGMNSNITPQNRVSQNNNNFGFNFPKINFGNNGNAGSANNVQQPTEQDAQFQLSGNPEEDAKKYAELKGIDLEQAKKELQSMYGEPTQGNEPATNPNNASEGAGNTERDAQFQLTGNPEEDAKKYAELKGIDLEQAKKELQSMYGEPNQMNQRYLFINN